MFQCERMYRSSSAISKSAVAFFDLAILCGALSSPDFTARWSVDLDRPVYFTAPLQFRYPFLVCCPPAGKIVPRKEPASH